jgi:DNA-binding IclR family transcriptional regulator
MTLLKMKTQGEKKASYQLNSVDNALRVIELLADNKQLGVTEIGQHLGISKATAFRLLSTLGSRGYIKKDANKYSLGMKFSFLGTLVISRMEITRYARPYLEELSRLSNEASHLAVWDDDRHIRFVEKITTPSTIVMESFVGLPKFCHSTATGKVLMAYRETAYLDSILNWTDLEARTVHTVVSPSALLEQLRVIRQDGYLVCIDEDELGLTCFAAPVFGPGGNAIAAVSISGPTTRMLPSQRRLIPMVRDAAEKITRSML